MARRPPLWPAVFLLALFACGGGLWLWQQRTRPGLVDYQRGLDDARAGRLQQAQQDWEKGIQDDPSYPGCYARLGDLYQNAGDDTKAASNYIAALKLNPNDGILFLQLARVERGMGDIRAAADAAAHAAQLRPNDPDAQSLCGQLEANLQEIPQALAALRRAYQLRPNNSADLSTLASLEIELSDTDSAERDLAPWLQAHPNDPVPCLDMADLLMAKPRTADNLRAGIRYAQRAMAGLPGDPRPAGLLSQFYLEAGRPQDALRTLLAASKATPSDEGILHGLVQIYTRLGQPQQVAAVSTRLRVVTARHYRIDYLRRALYFNRADTAARLELAQREEEDGQSTAAETDYKWAVRHAPEDPRTHAALASFFRRTDRPDLAKQAADLNFVP